MTTTYNWVYIVLGVVGLFGTGGIFAFVRWLKRQAVRDSKLDDLIDPEKGVMAILHRHGEQIKEIRTAIKPNGLNTNSIGDVTARTEKAVRSLREDFRQHIGESDAIHDELRRDLARKQDRIAP